MIDDGTYGIGPTVTGPPPTGWSGVAPELEVEVVQSHPEERW